MLFENRKEAGLMLASQLAEFKGNQSVVVMGLARGGVVVAQRVADQLKVPFDIAFVRKIGAPDNPELALGAVSDRGDGVFNDELIALLDVSEEYLKKEVLRQREEILQHKKKYLKDRVLENLEKKIVILIDDGIATGASMKAAIGSIWAQKPEKLIVAVPVASSDSLREVSDLATEVVCLSSPANFQSVGAFYKEFSQVSDDELMTIIRKK